MASSYTGLGTELMTTGENAGTWGTTTNTNLQIIEQLSGGYTAQSIAGSAQTTTLSVSDGSTGATLAHRVIEFTGTITGNQIVTIPLDVQQLYVVKNGTSGAYTVQFKYVSGSGSSVTFAATDKGTKILYAAADHASNPNLVDSGIGSTAGYDLDGNELTLDADSDTSITASTDDQIDIEIAGADDFTFTANAFNVLTGSHATFADSANAKFGTGNDMLMYHDGSNSYITNATGALKLATETSGIALTIGHTTSETTIADNLTTTGDTSVGGTLGVTGVATFATHVALGDSDILKLGAGTDLTLYHDGSNSYITNAVGALKIATETSGIAVTIGHTTSEVTVADNLTVTGTLTLGSNAELTEAELELLDGITAGTAIASKVVTTDSNIDTTGQRNLTISGELDAATLDISGNADIDGTMEADAYTLGGAAFIKLGGTDFSNSLLVGHATTGTLDGAGYNVGIGTTALDAITTGDYNIAIGYDAATAQTSANGNLAIGYKAMEACTTAGNNFAIGFEALKTGTNMLARQTALGNYALKMATTDGDTAVGYSAGVAITTGCDNTVLGQYAGDNITSGNANICIGQKSNVASATGDKQLVIGTTDTSDSSTVTWITGDSSGNLTFPNDLILDSDSAAIKFGDDQEITLTHTADDGLVLKHVGTGDGKEPSLTFQAGDNDIAANDVLGSIFFQAPDEGAGTDAILVAAGIEAVSEGDFSSSNNATKLSFKTAASEAAAEKMSLSSTGVLTVTNDIAGQNDLKLYSDAALIKFGANSDVTLTHVHDTGLLLNAAMQLQFRDSALAISSSTDGQLDIDADTEVEIATTTLDLNGALDVSGASQFSGAVTVGVDGTGLDVKFFGDTSGSFLLWDQSDDALELTDSSPIKIGDGGDMQIYHDGTNSYVTNSQGALKIATETSGIAVTIGHTTSETTVADNLTVTGDFAAGNFKFGGTDFTSSLLVGHSTTGTLDAAIQNTGVGIAALDALTSGDYNSALGMTAGSAVTTGTYNTLLGAYAGDAVTTNSYNTAVGGSALGATTGASNTAVGYGASWRNATGTFNTAVGDQALEGVATNNHSYNTAIGGKSNEVVTTGGYNVTLGYQSGDNLTTGSGNIIIGTGDAAAADSARTCKLVSYDGSSTTNHFISDSSGNVTLSGDLTVSGDDITMGTNTSGAALIADGTNFNPVVISGDISIATNGAASIAANSVDGTHIALGSDAQGDIMYYNGTNYVRLAPGTDGQFLKTQGSSANPAWADSSGIGMGKAIAAALIFG